MTAPTMDTDNSVDPFVFGFGFADDGTATPLNWEDVLSGQLQTFARCWIHLNRKSKQTQGWLTRKSGLDKLAVAALLQEDTRPRASRHGKGFLINLRGVNLNQGEHVEDMLSLRMWANENMLITLRGKPIQAARDVSVMVTDGEAPNSTGGLISSLANALTNRMEPEIANFDEQADAYEEQLLDGKVRLPRSALSEFRRQVLTVRRYILPQRDALAQLLREGSAAGLLNETDQLHVREAADRVTRLSEELETIRERSTVLQEQIMEERSDVMNQRLFFLSILSAVFLPISFVTGLFGVNIGGMPGMTSTMAFPILVLSLTATTVLMLVFFRWKRWI